MLLRDLDIETPLAAEAAAGVEVTGITQDSRAVTAGDLFVALSGERFDGRAFVAEAAERGAAAVLGAGSPPPGFDGIWLRHPAPRAVIGALAARLAGHPDRELLSVGVTGTNGKSTVVALVAAMLAAAGRPCARLGTLGYDFGELSLPATHTTPEANVLFALLRRMRDAGAEAAAMEVSSHALELGRVGGLGFDIAVFTNLSRDHFDFHPDIEAYFAAKRKLFEQLDEGGIAVVNVADPYGARLAAELPRVLGWGEGGEVRVVAAELDLDGIRATFATPRGELEVATRLLGAYNLENLTAAVAVGEALELPVADMLRGLAECAPLPGRMEPVDAGQPFPVIVDYAHTDAALAAAIRSLRSLGAERLSVVFGCGGDRDPGKRALMGRVAGSLADRSVLTNDNPRHERPETILEAVETGLRQSGNRDYRVIPDRREAIRAAIDSAGEGWAVLVAGKGHEEVQIVGDRALPFSDRNEVLAALEERFGSGTTR